MHMDSKINKDAYKLLAKGKELCCWEFPAEDSSIHIVDYMGDIYVLRMMNGCCMTYDTISRLQSSGARICTRYDVKYSAYKTTNCSDWDPDVCYCEGRCVEEVIHELAKKKEEISSRHVMILRGETPYAVWSLFGKVYYIISGSLVRYIANTISGILVEFGIDSGSCYFETQNNKIVIVNKTRCICVDDSKYISDFHLCIDMLSKKTERGLESIRVASAAGLLGKASYAEVDVSWAKTKSGEARVVID